MRAFGAGTKALLIGSALLLSSPLVAERVHAAEIAPPEGSPRATSVLYHHQFSSYSITTRHESRSLHATRVHGRRMTAHFHGISCVPYARQLSGIQITGNAWQWWSKAAGRYARGDRPEAGSVLNFRSNSRMVLGHVAAVVRQINAREVIVDHANWPNGRGYGHVSHNVAVVDVSEANNWSAVRVELGRRGTFGSVYPTYGFIYNRPDTGFVTASVSRPPPQPAINPVPSDLRPAAERPWHTVEEVAELPAMPSHRDNPQSVRLAGKPTYTVASQLRWRSGRDSSLASEADSSLVTSQ